MSNQKPHDEATALTDYGILVAAETRHRCFDEWVKNRAFNPHDERESDVDLAAIVASVELPKQDPFDWKAERAHLKAALARPCISCGYQSKTLTPSAPSPADAQREGT